MMAIFPRIERPCPYADRLDEIMDGDVCRMCTRQVFDLTDMDDAGRTAFLAACSGETCVSYRLPVRTILAATMLASATIPSALAAQDVPRAETQISDYESILEIGGIGAARRPMTIELLVPVTSVRRADSAERRAHRKAKSHAGDQPAPATPSSD